MARVYGYLYDNSGISWLPGCVSGWDADRLLLMNIQLIIVLVVCLCALLYMLRTVAANFKQSDVEAKCGACSAKKDRLQSGK